MDLQHGLLFGFLGCVVTFIGFSIAFLIINYNMKKDKKMTRKVDLTEYESMATCIKTDQVPPSEIAEIFTDKKFYKYYKKNWL